MSFEEKVKIETIRASNRNSNMPFLSSEFSKIFEDLFTMNRFIKVKFVKFLKRIYESLPTTMRFKQMSVTKMTMSYLKNRF